jgi:hypothetical protein
MADETGVFFSKYTAREIEEVIDRFYAKTPDDLFSIFGDIQAELVRVSRDLKDCRNELCLRCGEYKRQHLGACDGCRWKDGG